MQWVRQLFAAIFAKGAEELIAVYARQSVDRADSISIEQQIELCMYEARGEETRTYIDRGFSGKNTNRPRFTQMISDIREGMISRVVVYKLDRISRSILDFSNMMELFGRYGVEFVSATEKFDTSSPMGNAMLNICIVFAQLERETIQKRVTDAYHSRSEKSFYMGGAVPYGFRKVPAVIDGINTSMYETVDEEADTLKLIFDMYSHAEISYGDIARKLNDLGIKKRGSAWVRQRIRDIVLNPVYVKADAEVYGFFAENGAEISSPITDFNGINSCYSYKKHSAKKKSARPDSERIVIAPHEGIIDSDIWLRCRRKCMGERSISVDRKARNSWLCGKIKCRKCGRALIVKKSCEGRRRYFVCYGKMETKSCNCATVYADEVEDIVGKKLIDKIKRMCSNETEMFSGEKEKIISELADINKEMSGLLERVSGCSDVLFRYINERITELEGKKRTASLRLEELESRTRDDEISKLWEELDFDRRRELTDILVDMVYADEENVMIVWKI